MKKVEARKLLTQGNHKLGKNIASFSLPAGQDVCGRVCPGCYALKAQTQYPAVLPSRQTKLLASKKPNFVSLMVDSIGCLKPEFVRVHDSGEFYEQKYIDKWVDVAKQCPAVTHYAYTKRLKEFNFKQLLAQPNFVLIDSMHSGKLNYGKLEDKPKGMFLCPDYKGSSVKITGEQICGGLCTYCMTKDAEATGVWFVKH